MLARVVLADPRLLNAHRGLERRDPHADRLEVGDTLFEGSEILRLSSLVMRSNESRLLLRRATVGRGRVVELSEELLTDGRRSLLKELVDNRMTDAEELSRARAAARSYRTCADAQKKVR